MPSRDPSLHIKRSDLIKVISDMYPDLAYTEGQGSIKDMVDHILKMSKSLSPSNRLIVEGDKSVEKKIAAISKANRDEASLMAKVIFMVRKNHKHKGVEVIKPSSRDWTLVKSITESANKFCEDFDLPRKEGYTSYIFMGLTFMQKFRLQTLPGLYSAISERFEAISLLRTDTHPEETKKAHDYYRIHISKHTGVINTYEKIPEKMKYFIQVVDLAKSFGVSVKTYMDAQLEFFVEKMGTIPEPEQLVSEKAKIRLNKYLMKV